ncbi:MAG: Holliday junction resolvase RuvX [Limnochordia bacterium]|jgi:putative Holliday junction resolvase|nr:Holliday junction resolvase RuvX [Limnochordia bacterium]MDI9465131.1 Holliday junction resolvase RuvX [Bacillota bacterium]NLO95825.1 Holliday junction resolvase RuvX [Bacillota bacterium]HAN95464.1 Holliday junction resolvase RuvX [Bacillota bacterium]HOB41334.1 Holliday junction resolvase RuvX [Limnochordia bacterium]
MRVLGLDVGEKTIGVAVSDPLGWTAQGLAVVRRRSLAEDFAALRAFVQEYDVEKFVVGLPRRTDGSFGPEAEKIYAFAAELEREFALPVEYWDERFSTAAAQRILLEGDVSRAKRRKVIDKVAAAVILQAYLDSRRSN